MKNLVFNSLLICLIAVLCVMVFTMWTANFEGFTFSVLLAYVVIITIIVLPTKLTGLVK
jgi:hypothetical protein